MNPANLKFFMVPEARALAHTLGSCECHHSGPKGGSLHENADLVIERYEGPKCACFRLIQELNLEKAKEVVALYLLGRNISWDANGQYRSSEPLEHFRVLAEQYKPIHVLRYALIAEKLNIALDYLEGIPPVLAKITNDPGSELDWGSDAVDIED